MTAVEILPLDRLPVDRGVAAIVGGEYVAVFRLGDDEVVAVDHVDPCTGVAVLARGIVGSVGDRIVVASPLHKQRFDLHTGECLDDPDVSIRTWPVTIVDGVVRVASPARPARPAAAASDQTASPRTPSHQTPQPQEDAA